VQEAQNRVHEQIRGRVELQIVVSVGMNAAAYEGCINIQNLNAAEGLFPHNTKYLYLISIMRPFGATVPVSGWISKT
jgi:hypothetical protein